jgi:hypothetical protein
VTATTVAILSGGSIEKRNVPAILLPKVEVRRGKRKKVKHRMKSVVPVSDS